MGVSFTAFRVGLYAGRDVACHACTSFATLIAGFPLLSLTQIRAYIYVTRIKKKCFLPHFHSGAGGWVNPTPLKKNTSFALGMRRVCAAKCDSTEAIAQPVARRLRSRNAPKNHIPNQKKNPFFYLFYTNFKETFCLVRSIPSMLT